tara:strand:- start:1776 stop:2042 length:267 start_codon:yes stop_codon:yes gene_type:complete
VALLLFFKYFKKHIKAYIEGTHKPHMDDDIGLEILSKDEAFWKKAKEESEAVIEKLESGLKFEREVLKMAQENFKKATKEAKNGKAAT